MRIGTVSAALALACAMLILAARHLRAQSAPAQSTAGAAAENQQKARAALDAMVAALGGERWLTIANAMQHGRTASFYQGKPTGATADFWEYDVFPGQTRIDVGKKRNVAEIFTGDRGWEVTYRGKRALPDDQTQDVIRRRDHSIEAAVRVWLKDPKTILIYDGQDLVERHLADQVTLINSENDSITIQMDTQTHLPLRRSWQWRDPLYKDKNTDGEEYDNYHLVDGLPTPFDVSRYHNGDLSNQRFLYDVGYNVAVPPDFFDPDKAAAKLEK
jgi:hypothetical protein